MNLKNSEDYNNMKSIRFSHYWLMFGVSLLPLMLIFATLQWISNDRNYESLTSINDDLQDSNSFQNTNRKIRIKSIRVLDPVSVSSK